MRDKHFTLMQDVLLRGSWPLVTERKDHACNLDHGSPLEPSLPAGVVSKEVDLTRLRGHLGDPAKLSPAAIALLGHLDNPDVTGISLVNQSGCGRTKAAFDVLQVHASCCT